MSVDSSMARIPPLHRKYPVSMSIVTILAAVLLVYRWDIYRFALDQYRLYVLDISEPRVRNIAEQERITNIFDHHNGSVFGIDVSHYQRTIDWDEVQYLQDSIPIGFVICRSSMGEQLGDDQFKRNWRKLGRKGVPRGAYHYYRPNENSIKQADNFIARVSLKSGDIAPILDIEAIPRVQSMENLRIGLKRWLNKVEEHYGIRPILYTGDHYFHTNLGSDDFDDYPVWIANYSRHKTPRLDGWRIWQFSESGIVKGIATPVDLNVLNTETGDLSNLLLP